MAEKIKLGFTVDTSDVENATDEIIKLEGEVADLKKKLEDLEEGSDSFKKIEKSATDTEKKVSKLKGGVGLAGKAFTGLGNVIKTGLGLGIVIKLFDKIVEVLGQNQQILDLVNTAFTALSIVVNKVFEAVSDAFQAVSEANGGFQATREVISGLMTIALTPLKLLFDGIKLTILGLQLAWEESFLGKGDEGRIAELRESIELTKESIRETGVEALEAGQKVATNFIDAVGEVGTATVAITTAVVDTISNLDAEAILAQAKAINNSEKAIEKLEIQQQGLIEKYDLQAEQQRQIRDDVSRTFEERIAANERLGEILDEQAAAEKTNIEARIGLLRNQNAALGVTEERNNQILSLQNELAAVDARVTGQRSEQLTNINSLLIEQRDLERSRLDAKKEVADIEAQMELDSITNLEQRLLRERELLIAASDQRKLDLEAQIANEAEGTAKRVELENQYAVYVAQTNQQVASLDKKLADERKRNEEEVQNAKINAVASGLGSISQILSAFGEENKALAKAAVIVDAAVAAIGIWRGYAKFGPFGIAGAALQTAALLVATKKSIDNINKSDRASGVGSYGTPVNTNPNIISQSQAAPAPIPQAITLTGTGIDSTAQIGSGQGARQQSVRAYVVESDITETQNRLSTYQLRSEIG